MSSLSFTKLFSSITDSSVWQESDETRLVWITMLAMADQLGRINAAIPGLANRARVSTESTEKALEVFMSPDRYSRSKHHDGRRIEEIDGGWRLLNYAVYREMKDEEALREKNRIYQERFRAKRAGEVEKLGYIYYAQNGDHLKIGYSKNPWSRISELRTACPTLELVGLEKGNLQDEKDMHEKFSHLHHDREWFRMEPDLLKYVNALPVLEKLAYGRYRNELSCPVVQTVAKKCKNVPYYDQLRPATKVQGEEEAEGEGEEDKDKNKQKPSRVIHASDIKPVDQRYAPFKDAFFAHTLTTVQAEPSWGGRQAKCLSSFLATTPGIKLPEWQRILENRARSDIPQGEMLSSWIEDARKFWKEPLDRFGKPRSSNATVQGNSNTNPAIERQRLTHDAIRAAGERRYGAGFANADGPGAGSKAEPDVTRGDAGYVPESVGRDGRSVRDEDFRGRIVEGT
jgi:hypothetical protein